jgi:Tfp pilus assembly protein PilO
MSAPAASSNRLILQIRTYARVQWMFAAALFVTIGLFYVAVYRPQAQQLELLNRQIAFKKLELVSDLSQTGRLPKVSSDLEALRKRLAGFKRLPQHAQYGQFIGDVNRASERANLAKFDVEPGAPRRYSLYAEQPIALSFEGSFTDVFNFLRQIENMNRLTRLRDVDIKAVDEVRGDVAVKLSVNIYYSEG